MKKGNLIESFRLANEILPIAEDERNETGAFLKKAESIQAAKSHDFENKQPAGRYKISGYIYGFDENSQGIR